MPNRLLPPTTKATPAERHRAKLASAVPNRLRIQAGQLAMIDALLRSPDGEATIDDATAPEDLRLAFPDGGQWRGSVTRDLARHGLIEKVAAAPSERPSRHAGIRYVWRLADRQRAIAFRRRLAIALRLSATLHETTRAGRLF
jgi:hypothetical protein